MLRQLRVVLNSVKSHWQGVERTSGIGGSQVWALSTVRDRPGIGVTDLARALSVRQPTASQLVKNLSLQGLVEIRREGADRRAIQLHITAEGRKVLRRVAGPLEGILPQALRKLEDDALDRLHADLGRLIQLIGGDTRSADIPTSEL